MRNRWYLSIVMALAMASCARRGAVEVKPQTPATATTRPTLAAREFAAPIDVTGLPANSNFVVASCQIDFSEILARLNVAGAVDEHTLGLGLVLPDGRELRQPVQYTPTPQPRAKERRLLPGTTTSVSYGAEFAAADAVPRPRLAGELTWIADPKLAAGGASATLHYVLHFSVPAGGRAIQVPFAPQNLRAFDAAGRATPAADFPVMQIHPQWAMNGQVQLYAGRSLLTAYHLGPTTPTPAPGEYRRPFLYPVMSPDGVPLTEFGKPHDPTGSHAHHYSLWVAHNSVGGHEFWGEKGGTIVHQQLEAQEDGPVFCRIVQRNKWMYGEKDDVLHERRTLTAYLPGPDFRVMDVELEFTTPADKPVTLGKTTFGFLAARVAQSMTVFDGGGEILTSRGHHNEAGAHLQHAEWLDQSGPVAPSLWSGITLMDHPSNPNHPTMWHCRNDGWAGAAFCGDAAYDITPGKPLHLRYRVLVHRGDATDGHVAEHYAEFIASPMIHVGPPKAF
jgi:hypothetical protein